MNTFDPPSFALISSCLGIGRLLDIIALLIFLESSVTLREPLGFGTMTALDIQGAASPDGMFFYHVISNNLIYSFAYSPSEVVYGLVWVVLPQV